MRFFFLLPTFASCKTVSLENFLRLASSSAGVSCLFLFLCRLFFGTVVPLSSDLDSASHVPMNILPGRPVVSLSPPADEDLRDTLELLLCKALLGAISVC
jgi:hypothetical protein